MLRAMSAELFNEWRLFDELEPFGPERADYRAASIVSMLANQNRNSKKKPKPYTIEECRLMFGDAALTKIKPKADWKAMKAIAVMMTEESRLTPDERAKRMRDERRAQKEGVARRASAVFSNASAILGGLDLPVVIRKRGK